MITALASAAEINGCTTVAITGSGGLLKADEAFAAVGTRFLDSATPQGLTPVHARGLGDREHLGTDRVAHEDPVRRVIDGHWGRTQMMHRRKSMDFGPIIGDVGTHPPGVMQ